VFRKDINVSEDPAASVFTLPVSQDGLSSDKLLTPPRVTNINEIIFSFEMWLNTLPPCLQAGDGGTMFFRNVSITTQETT
jgi:hypothetical protein